MISIVYVLGWAVSYSAAETLLRNRRLGKKTVLVDPPLFDIPV